MNPYERLAELAARELEAVRGERTEELTAIAAERDRIRAALPAQAPAAARPVLLRAQELQQQVTAELATRLDQVREELTVLRQTRRMVNGYGATVVPAAFTLDRAA